MRYFREKYVSLVMLVLVHALLFSPLLACAQLISTPRQANLESSKEEEKAEATEAEKIDLKPPEVVLNDQKVIFRKQPILDEEGWLFPLREIAEKLQDKISVDIVERTITIKRFRDKSTIKLNLKNGLVTINNRPFKTLFGYNRIILRPDAQLVPTSALVILLGLTSKDDIDGKLILKDTIGKSRGTVGTVQPMKRTGVKDLLIDYLTVTNSFEWLKTQSLFSRRTEINSGFHNDNYAVTSDLLLRAGTGAPLINFDSGNFSYFKNNSLFQLHVGDKPLSLIKSPLLGGITLRGLQVQTKAPFVKDSRFTFGAGVLPTNGKVLGENLSFVRYGRIAEVAEWATSPKKDWQFSVGEALYSDFITNQLVRSKQTGGLFALSATKTGKLIEGDSNLAFGVTNDTTLGTSGQGLGGDILLRIKPKEWFSLFGKGAYYSPGFYPLTGNPYYHDRNEATLGFNVSPPRSNIGISHSIGKFDLDAKKPRNYSVTNVFASTTPIKKGPTIIASYSKNESEVSATRALDNVLFPINMSNISTVDLDTLIERRTNSLFRASILQNWRTLNFNAGVNYFTFKEDKPLVIPITGGKRTTKFITYDLNVNKSINRFLGLQSYIQGSKLYKQVKFGLNIGPVLDDKLNLLVQAGSLISPSEGNSPIYGFNVNYELNKKTQVSLQLDKTAFLTSVSGVWQYNLRGKRSGAFAQLAEQQTVGRIKGKVLVLEEASRTRMDKSKIVLPATTRERGLANIRINLGNYVISTDEKGEFEFPSLTPGVHRVRVEYADLPSYLTSITPESVDIKVVEGKETNFNFVLAYFGAVSGKLHLAEEPPLELEEEPELQDIRVYLQDTDFEALTNLDGSFVLGDVKPGKYVLKVDPDFLPEELDIDQKGVEIEIHGKQEIKNIKLPVKYRERAEDIKVF